MTLRQSSALLQAKNLHQSELDRGLAALSRIHGPNVSSPLIAEQGYVDLSSGAIEVSTSTVAALFLKTALTGQRIAMVDMVFLVVTAP